MRFHPYQCRRKRRIHNAQSALKGEPDPPRRIFGDGMIAPDSSRRRQTVCHAELAHRGRPLRLPTEERGARYADHVAVCDRPQVAGIVGRQAIDFSLERIRSVSCALNARARPVKQARRGSDPQYSVAIDSETVHASGRQSVLAAVLPPLPIAERLQSSRGADPDHSVRRLLYGGYGIGAQSVGGSKSRDTAFLDTAHRAAQSPGPNGSIATPMHGVNASGREAFTCGICSRVQYPGFFSQLRDAAEFATHPKFARSARDGVDLVASDARCGDEVMFRSANPEQPSGRGSNPGAP